MKRTLSTEASGWIYGFIHFSVEVCCFYFLFSRLEKSELWWSYAFAFDALAFIPQCFLGAWLDQLRREYFGGIGCLLLIVALFIPFDMPALVILTLGNAMVHIAGAKQTLSGTNGRITPCGTFVAGGSFGVITGQLLGGMGEQYIWIPLLCMIISAMLCVFVSMRHDSSDMEFTIVHSSKIPLGLVVFLAFLSAAVRSYVAYAIPISWKKETIHAIFLFSSMGLGKYLGGVLCDHIGYQKTASLSLILSLPFLLFGNQLMFVSLIGVGLFSMTMPVTVGILASALPKSPCFAFGITTVAPSFFVRPEGLLANQIIVLCLTLLAAVSLKLSIKRRC